MSAEQQQFWDFIMKTNPELIEGWKNRFECPVCLQICSEYGAVKCPNGHKACCDICRTNVLHYTSSSRCPVCRRIGTVHATKLEEDFQTISKLNDRLNDILETRLNE